MVAACQEGQLVSDRQTVAFTLNDVYSRSPGPRPVREYSMIYPPVVDGHNLFTTAGLVFRQGATTGATYRVGIAVYRQDMSILGDIYQLW